MRSWNPSVTRVSASCEGGDVGGVDDQRGLADGAADALDEFLLAVDVLRGLGPKDLVLDRRERGRLLAFGVLLGLDQQAEIREHALIWFEDDAQLVLSRAVHADLVRRVRVFRGDEVNREFALGAMDLVVEFEAEREVLTVLGVADLLVLMTSPERILNSRVLTSEASMSTFLISCSMTCSSFVRYS